MEEIEKFFKCPFCLEKISMLIDTSNEGYQTYVEDCEVCCNPIQVSYNGESGKIKSFTADKAYA